MVGARKKILWEEQLVDPPNENITPVNPTTTKILLQGNGMVIVTPCSVSLAIRQSPYFSTPCKKPSIRLLIATKKNQILGSEVILLGFGLYFKPFSCRMFY